MVKEKIKRFFLFMIGLRREESKKDVEGYEPKVTVLIPAYNEESVIARTIQSIKDQTYPSDKIEIIVIDDCSTDKTGEVAQSLGVRVVRTPQNTKMKAKAINFGLQFCSEESEIVIVVDADTVLSRNLIETYARAFSDEKVFITSGYILPLQTRTVWQKARLVQYLYYLGLIKDAQNYWLSPIVGSGCCLGIRKKTLIELGGFSEGHVAEDMALTWKGLIKGYKVLFLKEALCKTLDPINLSQYARQVKRWYRGFFQSFRENCKLLIVHNRRLAFFVFWYFSNAIINLFFWIFLIYGVITHHLFSWWFLSVEFAITSLVIFKEAYKRGVFLPAADGFLWYWIISPIDMWYFSLAFLQEIVFGRHLSFWEKGH